MRVINLFGGPGSGKSTTAAGLFHLMKLENLNVELVTEYAKDMVWEKRANIFNDQLYITAKQNRRLNRLLDHNIKFAITDSPLLLGSMYVDENYLDGYYNKLLMSLFDKYHNINFLLTRTKKYSSRGRNQTEKEANDIDINLLKYLNSCRIPLVKLDGDSKAPEKILEFLKTYGHV